MKFTYRWGQRPLDGFAIKRGLGIGGFGEVYFAVSDGGKEVAIKLIRGHSDIEVRGIANCLNLKHPNLVHLYDLRVDSQGNRWLVMEYVLGESLAGILAKNPKGLEPAQAREWFLQTARAVQYLHDHAVVHRDIKPANIFIENGIVKLGDYGLSKSATASQIGQSSNVGTIHYMAPEIAGGNYTRQIDVYACGVMLYEMLTGDVPFRGETWTEIAMRHQTELPDMSRIPAGWAPIVAKSLNKKVAGRYANLDEMIRAVLEQTPGPGKTGPSAAGILTKVTGVVPMILTEADHFDPRRPTTQSKIVTTASGPIEATPSLVYVPVSPSWRARFAELCTSMILTPAIGLVTAAIWGLWNRSVDWNTVGPCFLMTVLIAWTVLIPAKLWENSPSWTLMRRLVLAAGGVLLGVVLYWLEGGLMPQIVRANDSPSIADDPTWLFGTLRLAPEAMSVFRGHVLFFALALGLLRWWLATERRRTERFSFFPMLVAATLGLILMIFVGPMGHTPRNFAAIALTGAAAAVQIVSPWIAPARTTSSFRRRFDPNSRTGTRA